VQTIIICNLTIHSDLNMRNLLTVTLLALALASSATAQEGYAKVFVKMDTSLGTIVLEMYPDKAPKTVENFVQYVNEGYYTGTIFHRVIASFMIQGGGFSEQYKKKLTRAPIVNEADNMLPNARGTIAMARTAHPESATAQFFINVENNLALNHTGKTSSRAWGYAVFGQVVEGMEIVDAIRVVETGPGGPFRSDAPKEMVIITGASMVDSFTPSVPAEAESSETESP
jgi:peptidyl-prolyl cis-trans isomerase B (cyclophilin B)